MASRLPDNQEDRKVYLSSHDAAQFVTAVAKGRRDGNTIITTIEGFAHDPETLYVALDYAHHGGVAVTMAPADRQPSPPR